MVSPRVIVICDNSQFKENNEVLKKVQDDLIRFDGDINKQHYVHPIKKLYVCNEYKTFKSKYVSSISNLLKKHMPLSAVDAKKVDEKPLSLDKFEQVLEDVIRTEEDDKVNRTTNPVICYFVGRILFTLIFTSAT